MGLSGKVFCQLQTLGSKQNHKKEREGGETVSGKTYHTDNYSKVTLFKKCATLLVTKNYWDLLIYSHTTGEHISAFSFVSPAELTSSFAGKYGHISYILKATVDTLDNK